MMTAKRRLRSVRSLEFTSIIIIIAGRDGIWLPRRELFTQLPVGFCETAAGKGKNTNTRQIVELGQRVQVRALPIESRSLLAPAEGIDRALALLYPRRDDQPLILVQLKRNRK